jgi:glycosyltransferase involved in cell wall biosynthesis
VTSVPAAATTATCFRASIPSRKVSAPVRIAYDPQSFSMQAYGGVSRYFYETAVHLAALPDTEVALLAFLHVNGYLAGAPRGLVVGRRLSHLPLWTRRALVAANRALARRWLARHDVDLVHETYYAERPVARRGVPMVVTVFDMIHEKFPDYAPRTARIARLKRAAIGRADHLICISEHTRRDLIAIHGVEPARTSVVTLGFSLQPGRAPDAARPHAEPYILFVGQRGGYKAFDTLLDAYSAAPALQREFLLVAFGDAPFSARERVLMRELGIRPERVRHASGDDSRLAAHYRHASLFVYPSRYEGFGIPPLEAMSFDCPVVCSDAASLPEVAGDAAAMFASGDAQALRAAMERVLGSPAAAAALRDKGRARIGRFSWDACARQTRAIYASVLEQNGKGGGRR